MSPKKGKFECKICHQKFEKSQQLGGHQSKAHPGKSKKYELKIQCRERRSSHRELLSVAKRFANALYPNTNFKKNRYKLNKVRDLIKQTVLSQPNMTNEEAGQYVVEKYFMCKANS